MSITDRNAPAGVTIKERGVDVFTRQKDGAWKISISHAYPYSPAGAASDGFRPAPAAGGPARSPFFFTKYSGNPRGLRAPARAVAAPPAGAIRRRWTLSPP